MMTLLKALIVTGGLYAIWELTTSAGGLGMVAERKEPWSVPRWGGLSCLGWGALIALALIVLAVLP